MGGRAPVAVVVVLHEAFGEKKLEELGRVGGLLLASGVRSFSQQCFMDLLRLEGLQGWASRIVSRGRPGDCMRRAWSPLLWHG